MLQSSPLYAYFPARDLDRARRFYEEKLGFVPKSADLLPNDPNARKRAIAWMFAALNTVEPPIIEREMVMELEHDESWYEKRLPRIDQGIRASLGLAR
jgi:catechol 2,3-dioxygenase-like lactoylglutathione lyase family enzyme